MDKEKLDYWKTIITFLHNVLGDNYEIVLHVVDENDIYIGELVNSHISGRTISSPLTTFALDLIKFIRKKILLLTIRRLSALSIKKFVDLLSSSRMLKMNLKGCYVSTLIFLHTKILLWIF